MGAEEIEPVQDLRSYLDRSLHVLKAGYDRAETAFVRPNVGHLQQEWLKSPVTTTFVVVLCTLSFLPVFLFIIFSLSVFGVFFLLALGAALAASSTIVAVAGCLLACTLGALFFVSLGVTTFALSIAIGYRSLSKLRTNGIPEGAIQWKPDPHGQLEHNQQAVRPPRPEYEWSGADSSSDAIENRESPGFARNTVTVSE